MIGSIINQQKKDELLNNGCWKKIKLDPYLPYHTYMNYRWIKDLKNCKIGEKLYYGLRKGRVCPDFKSRNHQGRYYLFDLIQTKNVYIMRDTINKVKNEPLLGKIFAIYIID